MQYFLFHPVRRRHQARFGFIWFLPYTIITVIRQRIFLSWLGGGSLLSCSVFFMPLLRHCLLIRFFQAIRSKRCWGSIFPGASFGIHSWWYAAQRRKQISSDTDKSNNGGKREHSFLRSLIIHTVARFSFSSRSTGRLMKANVCDRTWRRGRRLHHTALRHVIVLCFASCWRAPGMYAGGFPTFSFTFCKWPSSPHP